MILLINKPSSRGSSQDSTNMNRCISTSNNFTHQSPLATTLALDKLYLTVVVDTKPLR